MVGVGVFRNILFDLCDCTCRAWTCTFKQHGYVLAFVLRDVCMPAAFGDPATPDFMDIVANIALKFTYLAIGGIDTARVAPHETTHFVTHFAHCVAY